MPVDSEAPVVTSSISRIAESFEDDHRGRVACVYSLG